MKYIFLNQLLQINDIPTKRMKFYQKLRHAISLSAHTFVSWLDIILNLGAETLILS